MDSLAQVLLYLAIALAVLLFFGPIVLIISIIGYIEIGSFKIDLRILGRLQRIVLGAVGLGVWLLIYIPLVLLAREAILPRPVATPLPMSPTPAVTNTLIPTNTPTTLSPTFTLTPTASPTSTPTATPTRTVSPTHTPTNTPTPTMTSTPKTPSPTAPPPSTLCKGDTSQELIKQAWEALDVNNFEKALACTETVIGKWTPQADEQQAKRVQLNVCLITPDPNNKEQLDAYWASYWALNDIATGWFIRGEVFYRQSKWAEAREAYKVVIDKYPCAFTWDPGGRFWRTTDSAQEKYDEIRSK